MNKVEWNRRRGYSKTETQLIQHTVGTKPDGIWGPLTVAAVADWQAARGILSDGLCGPQTWGMIQQLSDPSALPAPRHTWVQVPADDYGGRGYDYHTLRDDVAARYMKVYNQVVAAGGILTSSGSRRRLNANVSSNRSKTSLHYVGRAFDLYAYSGLVDPDTDPFICEHDADRWRVWAVAEGGEPRRLAAVTFKNPTERQIVVGRPVVNLTEMLAAEGFRHIAARRSFWLGSNNGGAEWWHFQDETGLVEGQTTFGDALLAMYTRKELEGTPPWEYRRRVWGENWG